MRRCVATPTSKGSSEAEERKRRNWQEAFLQVAGDTAVLTGEGTVRQLEGKGYKPVQAPEGLVNAAARYGVQTPASVLSADELLGRLVTEPTMCKPLLKVVKIDETDYWIDPDVLAKARRVFGVYVFDAHRRVHCCELTASYELHFVESQADLPDDLADEEREQVSDKIMAGDVALMECQLAATGEAVPVVCAATRLENGEIEFVPFATMFDDNPYRLVNPPKPEGGFWKQEEVWA